ncbi:OsmC family protein [Hydrogenophaga sp. PAMC20947]|uniref:OsmC family protein n=1 Tax=Hydrogenophaga sp. PAMC20947 TaxID=2565558 RepID=UPI001B34F835|nr:OsmC family protein [Hydrogenophaga sp. PAMC20947]
MVNIRPKTTIKMRMQGEVISHARTDVTVRDLSTTIDEPTERGGTNLGFSPTETFAAALVGCTSVISHKIAHRMGITFGAMSLRLEADFDRRGVTLVEEVAVPFPAMTLHIDVATDATPEQMEQLQRELAMFCPIAKLVRASGTQLTELWTTTPI